MIAPNSFSADLMPSASTPAASEIEPPPQPPSGNDSAQGSFAQVIGRTMNGDRLIELIGASVIAGSETGQGRSAEERQAERPGRCCFRCRTDVGDDVRALASTTGDGIERNGINANEVVSHTRCQSGRGRNGWLCSGSCGRKIRRANCPECERSLHHRRDRVFRDGRQTSSRIIGACRRQIGRSFRGDNDTPGCACRNSSCGCGPAAGFLSHGGGRLRPVCLIFWHRECKTGPGYEIAG